MSLDIMVTYRGTEYKAVSRLEEEREVEHGDVSYIEDSVAHAPLTWCQKPYLLGLEPVVRGLGIAVGGDCGVLHDRDVLARLEDLVARIEELGVVALHVDVLLGDSLEEYAAPVIKVKGELVAEVFLVLVPYLAGIDDIALCCHKLLLLVVDKLVGLDLVQDVLLLLIHLQSYAAAYGHVVLIRLLHIEVAGLVRALDDEGVAFLFLRRLALKLKVVQEPLPECVGIAILRHSHSPAPLHQLGVAGCLYVAHQGAVEKGVLIPRLLCCTVPLLLGHGREHEEEQQNCKEQEFLHLKVEHLL